MNDKDFILNNSFGVYHKRPEIPSYVSDLSLSKALISHVCPLLNKHHNIDYPYSYWITLLLPSTQIWIENVFDRFQIDFDIDSLPYVRHTALLNCSPIELLNYKLLKDIYCFQTHSSVDSDDLFIQNRSLPKNSDPIYYKSSLNHQLIKRRLLKLFSPRFLEIISYRIRLFKRHLYCLFWMVSKKRHNGYILQQIFIAKEFNDLLKKLKSRDIHPLLEGRLPSLLVRSQDFSFFRTLNLNFLYESDNQEIIEFISSYFTKYLPSYALEEFDSYFNYYKDFSCNTLICKCPASLESSFRHIFASLSLQKNKIITFQHGGTFIGDLDKALERIEVEFSDIYVSWRDDADAGTRGLVTGYNVNKSLNENLNNHDHDVLIIAPNFKRFHRYNLGIHPFDNKRVAKRIIDLITLLLAKGLNVMYRPYGQTQDLVSSHFGFKTSTERIEKQINSSRQIIICKPTTPVTECLIQGKIPILFFSHEENISNELAISLSELAKFGFYASDVESCNELITANPVKSQSPHELNLVKQLFDALFGANLGTVEDVLDVIDNPVESYSTPYNIIHNLRV